MRGFKSIKHTTVERTFRVTRHAIERYHERINPKASVSEIVKSAKQSGFYTKGKQYLRKLRVSKGLEPPQYVVVDPVTGAVFVCGIEGVARYTIITVLRHSQLMADIKAEKESRQCP